MLEKSVNAPESQELIKAGTDLYYAAVALLGSNQTSERVSVAMTNWRKLMERKHENHG